MSHSCSSLSLALAPIVLAAVCLPYASADGGERPIEFSRDVRPILSAHCFHCHGPDEERREADLRLDDAESALEDRGDYAAVVPGNLERSELVARITTDDPDLRMPPDDIHKPLSEEQIHILNAWVEQGAKYEQHWSFIPPTRAELPEDLTGWARNEIDFFVARRLAEYELTPEAEADRRTLARRVTLDLTGLPPTADAMKAFLADERPDAYDRLVDQLLESPHYGERMALDWLDAARYADTNGFSIDGGRDIWLYRDWVIDAFNRNLPYDQFLVQQLAGDLLPDPSEGALIATGFQRNNMVTHEGGTIPAENLVNYNADRVKTLGEAVLGLTLGCAQCHDHKYDPISQREYYRLFAYFNSIGDRGLDGNGGVNPVPYRSMRTVLQLGDVDAIDREIAEIGERLRNPDPADVAAWVASQREDLANRGVGLALYPVRLTGVTTPNAGAGFGIEEARYVRITKPQGLVAYDVMGILPMTTEPITGFRLIFHPGEKTPGKSWGYGKVAGLEMPAETKEAVGEKGTFVLSALSVTAGEAPLNQVNIHRLISLQRTTANSWLPNYRPERVDDTRRLTGWSPDPTAEGAAYITVTLGEPIDPQATPHLTAQFNFGFGKTMVAERFEIEAMTGRDDGSPMPDYVIAIVQTPEEDWTAEQQARLADYYRTTTLPAEPLRIRLANLNQRRATLTEPAQTMVMQEAEKPRDTFILNRGDYQQPGAKVEVGTPAVLPPPPAGAPANRLGLAQWLTMREHPLTARVAVNRLWKFFFGTGLSSTLADFGAQGEYPSHPELLDWLAVELMDTGWDAKAVVRKIVLSAAYRQSSVPTDDKLKTDPTNRLLARGPRFRLSAESIRDAALQMGGLLQPHIGGPSVNPYTPGDLWREVSHYGSTPATAQTFVQDHGEKLYRRSLYTFWKRTSPPPNMMAFDAPNRETCVVAREQTITPLQALVLLNDVQFVEAARGFAERIIARDDDARGRLRWAFAECLSRPPAAEEESHILHLLEQQLQRYEANPAAAEAYLNTGESLRNERIPAPEHAAWSQVAAVLLNLSETITRN
ncbi:PSD1 and planctomycete cytochrome C domain-containing protein [Pirellulales bacterium]|nr:PSD1 and planctomycete cytochrome C domain-containing protein [Pirellulales bacterium]